MKSIRSTLFAFACLGAGVLVSVNSAIAATCGEDYLVASGDSLASISRQVYDDNEKWTVIYNANIDILGEDPSVLEVGMALSLPCLDTEVTTEPDVAVAETVAIASNRSVLGGERLRLLTGDNYYPFTDRRLPAGGLATDLIDHALRANDDVPLHTIGWVNDWAAHLDPLLTEHAYDMGFPWIQPDCTDNPEDYRCVNFLFSEPIFEVLVLLFTGAVAPLEYNSDEDIPGKTLCRPQGFLVHDLEKSNRRWITNELIELRRPASVEDCFALLLAGEIDAVAINEFTGRAAVARMDISDKVKVIDSKPLSIEGLHVLVHKQHPSALALIQTINNSLSTIQGSASYQKILDRHLVEYWKQLETDG